MAFCSKCGYKVLDGDIYCHSCGCKINPPEQYSNEGMAKNLPEKPSNIKIENTQVKKSNQHKIILISIFSVLYLSLCFISPTSIFAYMLFPTLLFLFVYLLGKRIFKIEKWLVITWTSEMWYVTWILIGLVFGNSSSSSIFRFLLVSIQMSLLAILVLRKNKHVIIGMLLLNFFLLLYSFEPSTTENASLANFIINIYVSILLIRLYMIFNKLKVSNDLNKSQL